jgi:hypothetical protein
MSQVQNLQQAPLPVSPQPGQTGRGASVVSSMYISIYNSISQNAINNNN